MTDINGSLQDWLQQKRAKELDDLKRDKARLDVLEKLFIGGVRSGIDNLPTRQPIPSTLIGHTHPGILGWGPFRWLWRRLCCRFGWHLWDEYIGTGRSDGVVHELQCSACDAVFPPERK